MSISSHLVTICENLGRPLDAYGLRKTKGGEPLMGARLLLTLAGLESDFGRLKDFVRMEKAYAPGGKYYNDSDVVRALWKKWGCLAASSYGTFQMMFVTAREIGFTEHPIELQKDTVCAYWATQLITQRFIKRFKASTLPELLDCYNSGYHKDAYLPSLYIEKGIRIYDDLSSI